VCFRPNIDKGRAMSKSGPSPTRNSLLTALAAEDYALLLPHLTRETLMKGTTLVVPGEPITDIFFLETAIGSVVAISPEGHSVEATVIGCEGMTGLAVVNGTDRTPHQIVVQVEGDALRITADALRAAMGESATLMALMLRYGQSVYVQTTYTALSNASHGVEERLARWLLMCHDRVEGDSLVLTHEFLSIMLAVRRPSVTTALHVLEGMHLIRAERGKITMRDRQALEDFARDAYGMPEAEYARLVGPMPKAATLAAAGRAREANQKQIDALKLGSGSG
jgi:CRP-like cAMP-binding protein